jgi:hypothetical protein
MEGSQGLRVAEAVGEEGFFGGNQIAKVAAHGGHFGHERICDKRRVRNGELIETPQAKRWGVYRGTPRQLFSRRLRGDAAGYACEKNKGDQGSHELSVARVLGS